ncbi:protein phosphatase 2C domain-containing protein [Micromonospora sp. NBC_01813]|uniref:protein phosphatase 2C domain-containing protein n=1 Tax=Micromonospora sp. NBC_01813 TaxID=2975988 RepID=UPI002DD96597|nr:protein phosphatase 2C domain-containing protein [Micromonospora sp. NBC_01813]WSA07532.1 protein phosphatase 2C domain-containing protein [Micromonospora sp. NBC_01813]
MFAGNDFLIVLDGVTSPPQVRTGCVHDPVWLVRTLGAALAQRLNAPGTPGLTEVLADAITAVRTAHGGSCDLSHPESPSSTVVLLRERPDIVDYLVLCDSALILTGPGGEISQVVTDDRTAAMRGLTRAEVAERRNSPGGFWVASTVPDAAGEALTGAWPKATTTSVFACTDGVSRLVDHFGYSWRQVIDLAVGGPVRDVLDAVRAAESPGPLPGGRKQHDDATAALCTFPG